MQCNKFSIPYPYYGVPFLQPYNITELKYKGINSYNALSEHENRIFDWWRCHQMKCNAAMRHQRNARRSIRRTGGMTQHTRNRWRNREGSGIRTQWTTQRYGNRGRRYRTLNCCVSKGTRLIGWLTRKVKRHEPAIARTPRLGPRRKEVEWKRQWTRETWSKEEMGRDSGKRRRAHWSNTVQKKALCNVPRLSFFRSMWRGYIRYRFARYCSKTYPGTDNLKNKTHKNACRSFAAGSVNVVLACGWWYTVHGVPSVWRIMFMRIVNVIAICLNLGGVVMN